MEIIRIVNVDEMIPQFFEFATHDEIILFLNHCDMERMRGNGTIRDPGEWTKWRELEKNIGLSA